ncbi:MAG: hypothetical protein ACKVPX_09075 [Myxococcaceae bacterium]
MSVLLLLPLLLFAIGLFLVIQRPRPQAMKIPTGFALAAPKTLRAATVLSAVGIVLLVVQMMSDPAPTTLKAALVACLIAFAAFSLGYTMTYRCAMDNGGVHLRTLFGRLSLAWPDITRVDLARRDIFFFGSKGRDIRLSMWLDGMDGLELGLEAFAPHLLSSSTAPLMRPTS